MPRLSSLTRQHPVSASFGYEDESVTIVFDRNKITAAWARSVREALERDETNPAAQSLVEIMISWDVVDDAGNVLPPSVEVLDSLPIGALMRLQEAIGEASVPSDAEGKDSRPPSPEQSPVSTATAPTPPNGQAPSESPALSGSPS